MPWNADTVAHIESLAQACASARAELSQVQAQAEASEHQLLEAVAEHSDTLFGKRKSVEIGGLKLRMKTEQVARHYPKDGHSWAQVRARLLSAKDAEINDSFRPEFKPLNKRLEKLDKAQLDKILLDRVPPQTTIEITSA